MLVLWTGAQSNAVAQETPAQEESGDYFLDVSVNGWPLQMVARFHEKNGRLSLPAEQFEGLGFVLDPALVTEEDGVRRVYLDQVPEFSWRIDEVTQSIEITAPFARLSPRELAISPKPHRVESSSDWGAMLSYDVYGEWALAEDSQIFGRLASTDLEVRLFGPTFFASTNGYYTITTQTSDYVRLESYVTFDDPDAVRTLRLGDSYSSSLPWTRSIRFGGIHFARNFALRPDIVTEPTPQLSEGVAVPSSVDLFVNGMKNYSTNVDPGSLLITDFPIINGANSVSVVIADASGRRRVIDLPYYDYSELLARGLSEYSVEAGSVRENFGTHSGDYGASFASASLRYGLTDSVTLESHGEIADHLTNLGVGVAFTVRDWFAVSAVGAASDGASGQGGYWSASLERAGRRLNFAVRYEAADAAFEDLAAHFGQPHFSRAATGTFGLNFNSAGQFDLVYTMQRRGQREIETAAAVYGVSLFDDRMHVDITGFADLNDEEEWGATVTAIYRFRGETMLTLGASERKEFSSRYAQLHGESEDGRLEWVVHDTTGDSEGQYAGLSWRDEHADILARIIRANDSVAVQADVAQSLVFMDGDVYLGAHVDDAFTVVDVEDTPGVHVYRENHLVGQTNGRGHIFVNDLRGFEANSISIAPADVPIGGEIDDPARIVAPRAGGGVITRYAVTRDYAAVVIVKLAGGEEPPPGARVTVNGAQAAVMGFGGEAYLRNLTPGANRARVEWPGHACEISFPAAFDPNTLPRLGPFTCDVSPSP